MVIRESCSLFLLCRLASQLDHTFVPSTANIPVDGTLLYVRFVLHPLRHLLHPRSAKREALTTL